MGAVSARISGRGSLIGLKLHRAQPLRHWKLLYCELAGDEDATQHVRGDGTTSAAVSSASIGIAPSLGTLRFGGPKISWLHPRQIKGRILLVA
jgi:hypothetical protein